MPSDTDRFLKEDSLTFINVAIRLALLALLVILAVRVISPFMDLLLSSLILAIVLYPLHQHLAKRLGRRQGAASVMVVALGLVLIGVPLVVLGASFANRIHSAYIAFEQNKIYLPQPDPKIAEWPIIGTQLFQTWSTAAANLPAYLRENKEQLTSLSMKALSVAANTFGSLLLALSALIIAGIVMAYGEPGNRALQRVFRRLAGPVRGPKLQQLSTATVRSVANGVIGVAFIQALLLGVGFIMAGIPGAGVLALLVLLLGIAQLPAVIISLPAIIFLWWFGEASTISSIFCTIYLLLAGMADNVLKPVLIGRGVDAPMPVILIGALGGMVYAGIIGLFLGAVLLAVGYQLFMEWVSETEDGSVDESGLMESTARSS